MAGQPVESRLYRQRELGEQVDSEVLIDLSACDIGRCYVSPRQSLRSDRTAPAASALVVSSCGPPRNSPELAQYGTDPLISRSHAKRILACLESFAEAILDFSGVDSIGQAFADEIFRVFARAHPGVKLTPIHANEEVNRMIRRAIAGTTPPQGKRP